MSNEALHHVRILDNADEALQMLVQKIEAAKQTIDIQYFIMHRGPTASLILALLSGAADRGVKIRILFDGLATRWGVLLAFFAEYMRPEIQGFLEQHANVELKFYHPLKFPFKKSNRRLHGKMLLIDNEHLISGGRNIGDKFFGKRGPVLQRIYLDRDIYIHSKVPNGVPQQVAAYFQALWESGEVSDSPMRERFFKSDLNKKMQKGIQKQKTDLKKELDRFRSKNPGVFDKSRDWLEGAFRIKNIRFVHDPIGVKGDSVGTAKALYELFANAKKSIRGQTPYIVPTESLVSSFRMAQSNGAKISFLTNSVASSPNLIAIAAYDHYKPVLLKMEIDIWEYEGEYNLHHKSYIIDKKTSVLGTFNLDPRSARSNTELLYIIKDESFAKELKRIMDTHMKNAVTAADTRGAWKRLTLRRCLVLKILKILAPLLKEMA